MKLSECRVQENSVCLRSHFVRKRLLPIRAHSGVIVVIAIQATEASQVDVICYDYYNNNFSVRL